MAFRSSNHRVGHLLSPYHSMRMLWRRVLRTVGKTSRWSTNDPLDSHVSSQYFPSWCDNYRIPTGGLFGGSKLPRELMNSVEYDHLQVQNTWNRFSVSPLQNNQWYQNIAAVIVGTPKTDRSVPKIILSWLHHLSMQYPVRQLHCWRIVSSASRNRSYSYTWGGNIQNSSILLGSLKGKSLMTRYSQGSQGHSHPLNHNSLHISSDTCASLL